jgi:pyruvate,water dikinase
MHPLESRPADDLPQPITWNPPGPGLWACNFRLGEWLPDPITPLFADWLLPIFDRGFRDAMRDTAGAAVAIPYALVNGWYYASPAPPIARLPGAVVRSRGRVLRFMITTVLQPTRNPVAADRALDRLYRDWHNGLLPDYRALAATDPERLDLEQLMALTEQVAETAGRHFWYLAVVGGAAWKMERALGRFLGRHGLADIDTAVLLSGLSSASGPPSHAVHSLDWFHPTAVEGNAAHGGAPAPIDDSRSLLEQRCTGQLSADPAVLSTFIAMLGVARKYVRIREQQTNDLTLGWPLIRRCAHRMGVALSAAGILADPDELFFLTRQELEQRLSSAPTAQRRRVWQSQRRLAPPLTLGRPPALIGRHLVRTLGADRSDRSSPRRLLGQPASPGRATEPACIVHGVPDFAKLHAGDVLVAPATTPTWTLLFGRAAAVVTDRGTAAAHAAIVAREYGIPAVVATTDATSRLRDGVIVTVDGSRGVVTIQPAELGDAGVQPA